MSDLREPDVEFISGLTPEQWRQWAGMTLARMETQVLKTNGRVTSLEKFRWVVAGGLAVVTAVVVPLFLETVSR